MDVMEDREVGSSIPDRREPGHAVPDLDEAVTRSHPAHQLGGHRPGEDRVAAAAADDVVAVTAIGRRQPDRGRRAVDDVEPGRRPAPHELVGMDLGPARVGVVEVAPGQHVEAADAGLHDLGHHPIDLELSLGRGMHPPNGTGATPPGGARGESRRQPAPGGGRDRPGE